MKEEKEDIVKQQYSIKKWFSNAFHISILLGKSAYLSIEKRHLLLKLGRDVFSKYINGSFKDERFEVLLSKLENINKEITGQEKLINEIRFGKSSNNEGENERVQF